MADDTYDSDPYTPYENDSIIKIQHWIDQLCYSIF
jgi:hypothetical protein